MPFGSTLSAEAEAGQSELWSARADRAFLRELMQAAGRLLPEVVAHNEFIQHSGLHGGWHPQVDPVLRGSRYEHTLRLAMHLLSTTCGDCHGSGSLTVAQNGMPPALCFRIEHSLMQDAADFDRAVTAARGNYSHAIRISCDTLPGLGEDAVRQHACWHREASGLAAGKRAALDRRVLTFGSSFSFLTLQCVTGIGLLAPRRTLHVHMLIS